MEIANRIVIFSRGNLEQLGAPRDVYENPANEFVGLPVAEELMRDMNIQVQKEFDGAQTAKEAAANTQKAWLAKF